MEIVQQHRHTPNKQDLDNAVQSYPADAIRALAFAVANPGAKALLLGPDNRARVSASGKKEFIPLMQACLSGESYTVEVQPDIIALDADDEERGLMLENDLAPYLQNRQPSPVLIASGRAGNRHLFVRVDDAETRAKIEDWSRKHGIDVRTSIRPPLSPHRSGFPVRLIAPASIDDAIKALAPTRKSRKLSDRIFSLLRSGDTSGRYGSRSEVVQAITLGAINAGFPKRWLGTLLLDKRNLGGLKVQEIERKEGRDAAAQYIHRCYLKGLEFADAHPVFSYSKAVTRFISALRSEVDKSFGPGRAAATDRAIFLAHLEIAERCGRTEYRASLREIAEKAGVGLTTVRQSSNRLINSGHLRLVKPTYGCTSTTWKIEERSLTYNLTSWGCEKDCTRTFASSTQEDVWRWGALGKTKARIWSMLDGDKSSDLAHRLGTSMRAIQLHLKGLANAGLAARQPDGGWRRIERDLRKVASELGVEGIGERQRMRHHIEREVFALRRNAQGQDATEKRVELVVDNRAKLSGHGRAAEQVALTS